MAVGSSEADTAAAGEAEGEEARPTLALRGDLPEAELDALCVELGMRARKLAAVDLRDLSTVEPPTLAVLLAALRDMHRQGNCDLDRVKPCRAQLNTCLGVEGVAALRDGAGHWQTPVSDRLIGWQLFSGGEEVQDAARVLTVKLTEHTVWSPDSCAALSGLAFELGENVRQHSASSEGVVALETDGSDKRIRMAVADAGIGIRTSLARNPEHIDLDDDLTAIERAVRAGETGEPGAGGGMGLCLTRAIVRGNGGRVLLRSGDACWEESEECRRRRRLPPLRGTLIGIEARTDRPLDDEEVWERIDALGGPRGVREH